MSELAVTHFPEVAEPILREVRQHKDAFYFYEHIDGLLEGLHHPKR